MTINRWVNIQNMHIHIYIQWNITQSFKNEGNSDTCYSMNETWRHYTRWNKPVRKDKYCIIPLKWGIYDSQIYKDRKYNGGCQGLGEGGNWELLLEVYRISVWEDEKSSEDKWWWWLHNNMNKDAELYT